jgi:hypothetical protein
VLRGQEVGGRLRDRFHAIVVYPNAATVAAVVIDVLRRRWPCCNHKAGDTSESTAHSSSI